MRIRKPNFGGLLWFFEDFRPQLLFLSRTTDTEPSNIIVPNGRSRPIPLPMSDGDG